MDGGLKSDKAGKDNLFKSVNARNGFKSHVHLYRSESLLALLT